MANEDSMSKICAHDALKSEFYRICKNCENNCNKLKIKLKTNNYGRLTCCSYMEKCSLKFHHYKANCTFEVHNLKITTKPAIKYAVSTSVSMSAAMTFSNIETLSSAEQRSVTGWYTSYYSISPTALALIIVLVDLLLLGICLALFLTFKLNMEYSLISSPFNVRKREYSDYNSKSYRLLMRTSQQKTDRLVDRNGDSNDPIKEKRMDFNAVHFEMLKNMHVAESQTASQHEAHSPLLTSESHPNEYQPIKNTTLSLEIENFNSATCALVNGSKSIKQTTNDYTNFDTMSSQYTHISNNDQASYGTISPLHSHISKTGSVWSFLYDKNADGEEPNSKVSTMKINETFQSITIDDILSTCGRLYHPESCCSQSTAFSNELNTFESLNDGNSFKPIRKNLDGNRLSNLFAIQHVKVNREEIDSRLISSAKPSSWPSQIVLQMAAEKKCEKSSVFSELIASDPNGKLTQALINLYKNTRFAADLLTAACMEGYIPTIQRIVKDARTSVDVQDSSGWTPLAVACYYGKLQVIDWLLKETSADVNLPTTDGMTPLLVACAESQVEISYYLLNNVGYTEDLLHLNVNADDKTKRSALHYIIERNRKNGLTKLHEACLNGSIDILRNIIYKTPRSEINVQDNDGWTPLHLACMLGHIEIVILLIWAGADTEVVDYEWNTPGDYAIKAGYDYLTDVLQMKPITEWLPWHFPFYTELIDS